MVWTGPTRPLLPRLALRPELTEEDVAWLNRQMGMTDDPPVRYAREIPLPPLPSGAYSKGSG